MKTVFLNVWNGKFENELFEFINTNKNSTDLFSFSEVTQDLYKKLIHLLPDFDGYSTFDENVKDMLNFQTFFVTNKGKFSKYDKKLLYTSRTHENNIEVPGFVHSISSEKLNLSIINFQGIAYPGDKLDTKERLKQSKDVLEFSEKVEGLKIIMGDFNLLPETKSIKMIEDAGYRNLIKEFKIKTTRNRIAWEYFEKSKKDIFYGRQKFADYCFVTKDIRVKKFEVPNLEISDHLPLMLEFN